MHTMDSVTGENGGDRTRVTHYLPSINKLSAGDRSVCNFRLFLVGTRYKAYRDKITYLIDVRLVILSQ